MIYYRGLYDYQYHFEVHLRYHIPQLYKEYGTIILVIIQAPILMLGEPPFSAEER